MIKKTSLSLALVAAVLFVCGQARAYDTVGQPSVFWRDGEWQVYKDGHWIAYADTKVQPQMQPAEPERIIVPAPAPEAPMADTNGYYYDGGYGYGLPLVENTGHRHSGHHRIHRAQAPQNLNDRAIGNIGRTTIGIGQQSGGIGPQR